MVVLVGCKSMTDCCLIFKSAESRCSEGETSVCLKEEDCYT